MSKTKVSSKLPSNLPNNPPSKSTLITITIIVFIVAEIGRLGSMGWGFFFTPGFAILFLAASGCFIALKNKKRPDYIIYGLNSLLYLIWGYTWVDIPDYGGPGSYLINLTGVDYHILNTICYSTMTLIFCLDIFQIIRINTQNRVRKDSKLPYDSNRNLMLGIVVALSLISLAGSIITALIRNLPATISFTVFSVAIFAWGGISYANLKQKAQSDHWLFALLCIALLLYNIGYYLLILAKNAYSIYLTMGGIVLLIVATQFLFIKRHREKYTRLR